MGASRVPGRRLVILADGHLDFHFGKTAMGLIRYRPEDVIAVIDRDRAGHTTAECLGLGGDIPIVATLAETLDKHPDALVIGVATRGGLIPPEWRPTILEAIANGMDVLNGLHQFLGDDPQLSEAATAAGVHLIDVRRPPQELAVAESTPHRPEATVITLVGSDCAVGKMSVALDIQAESDAHGRQLGFVATGQTGMMIAGAGIPLDRIIGDFMSGAVEREVLQASATHDVVLVEGQGSLLHPAYSGVTLALLHGSQPDGLILVVMPSRSTIEDYPVAIPSPNELIRIYEEAAGWIKAAPVVAIAVNSLGLTESETEEVIARIEGETGLPAADTFRGGAGKLLTAVLDFHDRRTVDRVNLATD